MEYNEWQKKAYQRQKQNEYIYGYEIAADIWLKEYDEFCRYAGDTKHRG